MVPAVLRLRKILVLCVWEAAGQVGEVLGGKAACLGFLGRWWRPPGKADAPSAGGAVTHSPAHAARGGDHQQPQQTHPALCPHLSLLISQVIKGGYVIRKTVLANMMGEFPN